MCCEQRHLPLLLLLLLLLLQSLLQSLGNPFGCCCSVAEDKRFEALKGPLQYPHQSPYSVSFCLLSSNSNKLLLQPLVVAVQQI